MNKGHGMKGFILSIVLAAAAVFPASADPFLDDTLDVARKAGTFTTLLAAVDAVDPAVEDALEDQRPITVFAPSDAAFAKLPSGTVATLLKPENLARLKAILTYHVVVGEFPAARVPTRRTRVTTLNPAAKVVVVRRGNNVYVDGVRVVRADIRASNGIVHVIDRVLMPSSN